MSRDRFQGKRQHNRAPLGTPLRTDPDPAADATTRAPGRRQATGRRSWVRSDSRETPAVTRYLYCVGHGAHELP